MPRARNRQQNGYVLETGKSPRTWTGYYYIYDEQGTRKKRSKVIGLRKDLKKSEAEDKLRAFLRGEITHLGDAVPSVDSVTDPLSIEVERYIRLKRGDWGRRNLSVMQSVLGKHVVPSIGRLGVAAIKPSDIKEWITSLAEAHSKSMVQKCLTHVRAIFEQLIEDGKLARNPARKVRLPRNTRKVCDYFMPVEDCQRLLAVATGRDRLILRILLAVGLRPSEIFALRLEDVSPGQLRIDEGAVPCEPVKGTKTDESNGWVPMSPDLESELRWYIAAEGIADARAFLFPSRRGTAMNHNNYLKRHLKPLGERAGVSRVTFQAGRRTVGTHTQKHGEVKSTQGLLRHAYPDTTLIHYQKRLDPEVIEMANRWDSELLGASPKIKE